MSPNEFREALQLADALAEFANLEPANTPAFRQEHPNFAPEWWAGDLIDVEHAGAVTPIWQREQARIRDRGHRLRSLAHHSVDCSERQSGRIFPGWRYAETGQHGRVGLRG